MLLEHLSALLLLTVLEVVLGIDNIVFITLLASRLPTRQQGLGERLGIGAAVLSRIALLTLIEWIQRLRHTVAFAVFGHALTYRALILVAGGLFLLAKSTHEIYKRIEAVEEHGDHIPHPARQAALFPMLGQIFLMDVVFSLDSVITAVGMARSYWVMIAAILLASVIMMVAVEAVSRFLARHPSMKILALSFLVLIGALLVIEGWAPERAEALHLKNYAYFAMAFSFLVELINIRVARGRVQRATASPLPPNEEG